MWRYLHKKFGRRGNYFTSTDIEAASGRLNLPISEIQSMRISCDISSCFGPPRELSADGSTLLDFLTHTVNFAQAAPAAYRDDVLRFLGSEACSERGPDGEVIFNGSNAAVIVRKV